MIKPKPPIELLHNVIDSAQPSIVNFGYTPAADDEHARYNNAFHGLVSRYIGAFTANPEDLGQDIKAAAEEVADLLGNRGPLLGYVAAMREGVQVSESLFRNSLDSIRSDNKGEGTRQSREEELRNNTIDLVHPDKELVSRLFPSGNWLLHSTNTERISAIVNRGAILPTITLARSVSTAEHSKGGSFGLSYNFNQLGVLVGTPRHEAGFMADPGTILAAGGILAVPFKSTRFEVQYYNAPEEKLQDIRDLELSIGALNGVAEIGANISRATMDMYGQDDDKTLIESDKMHAAEIVESIATMLENPAEIRKCFIVSPKGNFEFSSMVFMAEAAGTSAVIQAALDGHFGMELQSLMQSTLNQRGVAAAIVGPANKVYEKISESYSAAYKEMDKLVSEKTIARTNDMLFYCSKRDYELWVKALSKSPNMPRGIVVYNVPDLRTSTTFNSDALHPARDQFSQQLESLRSEKATEWNTLFDDVPKVRPDTRHIMDFLQTGIAGFLSFENGQLVQKTIDDIE